MKIQLPVVFMLLFSGLSCIAQDDLVTSAKTFINSLNKDQQLQAQYPFDSLERFVWHYVPKNDRKGISLNELTEKQKETAFALMKTALSDQGYKKAKAIMQLEKVLKVLENRQEGDNYRDPGKYFFTLFGQPSNKSIWGWRLDGHHISFNFSSENNRLVAGTPGFLGANPAVVLTGFEKGLEILKEENEMAFELLNTLDPTQRKKAIISELAPGDIITTNSRKAMIADPGGLHYGELTAAQKKIFLKLLSLYIHRYTRLFALNMMTEVEKAGLHNLVFAWAGSQQNSPGNKRYYRIKGPTIIIEYDNTQNDGNHVHTVLRDLNRDFGGDELLEHYRKSH